MKACSPPCTFPNESFNPRKAGECLSCGRRLDPAWVSSDKTMGAMFARLAEACPPGEATQPGPNGTPELTPAFMAFEAECLERERRGRDEFGLRYLRRRNEVEAQEEWADGANYLVFASLRELRENGSDEDIDVVLTGMYHAFKAFEATLRLRARRHGAP